MLFIKTIDDLKLNYNTIYQIPIFEYKNNIFRYRRQKITPKQDQYIRK